jgi:hypothetical protein
VTAKGKTDPVRVWQALAARASLGVDVAQAPRTSGERVALWAGATAYLHANEALLAASA